MDFYPLLKTWVKVVNMVKKYGLDSAKKSTTDAIKTASKRAIQKTRKTTNY